MKVGATHTSTFFGISPDTEFNLATRDSMVERVPLHFQLPPMKIRRVEEAEDPAVVAVDKEEDEVDDMMGLGYSICSGKGRIEDFY